MTATLPDLERVYAEAFEGAIVAQESQAEAFRAALLAVYRAGQEAQRDMPPTSEMIDAGGSEDIDYETDTHYTISIGYLSGQIYRAMQAVAPLEMDSEPPQSVTEGVE